MTKPRQETIPPNPTTIMTDFSMNMENMCIRVNLIKMILNISYNDVNRNEIILRQLHAINNSISTLKTPKSTY